MNSQNTKSSDLPNVVADLLPSPLFKPTEDGAHKPRILFLYGSNRKRSFSRLLTEEAQRLLNHLGAETKVFNPSGLPLPDDADDTHPKVQELRELVLRPSQGKTLAVMQVSGGSQSFNAVNQMRILGRWMRMFTIPNQSSVAKAFQEFDEHDRMKPSAFYDRLVDVMEELMKFTLLLRDHSPYLVDRYSERVESAEALSKRVNQSTI